ncbi:MAG: M3 family metallopeptidase [Bacteroidales bacterium]
MVIAQDNPLLQEFNTPHETAPFDIIKTEHFLPAFEEAIKQGEAEVKAVTDNPASPTFENTIEQLERSGKLLDRIALIFFNLLNAETNDELQQLAREVSPKLTIFQNDIKLNPLLFERIKAVYNKKDGLNLTPEQQTLVEKTYTDFVRQGASLSEAEKERFREISTELSQLSLMFGENVLKETNRYEMHITDKSKLAGLPASELEAAAQKAKSMDKEGWVFDLTVPSFIPVLRNAENRDLREELFLANMSKSFKGDELDNQDNIIKIVNLRFEMARLLGYDTYADYILERCMAMNTEGVYKLLDDLYETSYKMAQKDKEELQKFAEKIGFSEEIMPWDRLYYSEKLKEEKFNINDEMLKPYFELKNVIDGVFGLATELFGITFTENREIPVYHEEVIPYEVYDKDGSFLSVLYADFHPRPGKREGARMGMFKRQWIEDGRNSRPHIIIVMNFTRPTETRPALLTFKEMEIFLHEFGHALHGIFANSDYASLSGLSVWRDFIELPSQLLENWAVEKEFLDSFARHYETGEPIPSNLVESIKASENFQAGYFIMSQMGGGLLDMAWHTQREPFDGDVKQFEEEAWKKTQIFPVIDQIALSTQFQHIFAGGYAAGFYGYQWAQVLDADAFSLFKEKGLFNKEVAQSLREHILEKGGTEHPMVLYKRFRGQEPTVDALLERSGLK